MDITGGYSYLFKATLYSMASCSTKRQQNSILQIPCCHFIADTLQEVETVQYLCSRLNARVLIYKLGSENKVCLCATGAGMRYGTSVRGISFVHGHTARLWKQSVKHILSLVLNTFCWSVSLYKGYESGQCKVELELELPRSEAKSSGNPTSSTDDRCVRRKFRSDSILCEHRVNGR